MNLKNFRKGLNKTQEQVAKELNIQKQTYQNYELGKRQPDNETLIKLADYYHTTIDNLLDHKVPYLLDKSTLSEKHRILIDLVLQLNSENCDMAEGYLSALIDGERVRSQVIEKFRR